MALIYVAILRRAGDTELRPWVIWILNHQRTTYLHLTNEGQTETEFGVPQYDGLFEVGRLEDTDMEDIIAEILSFLPHNAVTGRMSPQQWVILCLNHLEAQRRISFYVEAWGILETLVE